MGLLFGLGLVIAVLLLGYFSFRAAIEADDNVSSCMEETSEGFVPCKDEPQKQTTGAMSAEDRLKQLNTAHGGF